MIFFPTTRAVEAVAAGSSGQHFRTPKAIRPEQSSRPLLELWWLGVLESRYSKTRLVGLPPDPTGIDLSMQKEETCCAHTELYPRGKIMKPSALAANDFIIAHCPLASYRYRWIQPR